MFPPVRQGVGRPDPAGPDPVHPAGPRLGRPDARALPRPLAGSLPVCTLLAGALAACAGAESAGVAPPGPPVFGPPALSPPPPDSLARPAADPAAPGPPAIVRAPVAYSEIADDIPPDPAVEAMIAPYRERIGERLAEVVGHATDDFFKADPEGGLDNLVADALLAVVQDAAEAPVDVVLVNEGGLRVPLAAGPIRMRHAYELLPFENYVTVLSLTGEQMERLADEIARANGEPIAGWTMELEGEDATNVRVGGEPVDPGRVYRLATVDYLVDGGGTWSVLWEAGARERKDLPMLIRDVFVSYLREVGTVTPTLDGRIRRIR